MPSGTITVPAGQDFIVVAGTFPSSYEVSIAPSWVSAYGVPLKTAASFRVDFAVTSPGGTLDSLVTQAGASPVVGGVTLAAYLEELRRLLHDPDDRYWSQPLKVQ